MPPEPFWLEVGNLHIVPVCHYRMEFAREVRRSFLAIQPQRVALELPQLVADGLRRAVERLPRLTTLAYPVGDSMMLVPMEPTDAFVEAARSAVEAGVPVHCVNLAVSDYGSHDDPVPDSSSLTAIGLKAFWEQWQKWSHPPSDPLDGLREGHIAQSLRMLSKLYPDEKILVVLGLVHVSAVMRLLESPEMVTQVPLSQASPGHVQLFQPDPNSLGLCQEMPWVMSLYELQRAGPGADSSAWESPPEPPEPVDEDPRDVLSSVEPAKLVASLESLLGLRRRPLPPMSSAQRKALSRYLHGLVEKPAALFQLFNQFDKDQAIPKLKLPSVNPPPRAKAFTFRQVRDRRGQMLELYRDALERAGPELDRQSMLQTLIWRASEFYHDNTGDHIAPWQVQVLYQFSRNYAQLYGRLLPSLFQLTMSARGVADDNFSYEVWDLGSFHPWNPEEEEDSDLPMLRLKEDDLFLGDQKIKRWSFHRKLPRLRQRLPIKGRRDREGSPGEWSESFENGSLCSYPPEDLVIEDYARYLQKKAIQQLSLEKSRIEPFTTSLLDGIDMRETLRNWHERKIYVRETRRVVGGVGAVVVVFDEDDSDERYPWRMTWHGEHSQESDMAFYATPFQQKIVGPGIARCEYGGILMTYPNRQLPDVWGDSAYEECRSKAEVLLMAALEYGMDRHVVFVASKPPRSNFRTVAGRLGKKLVYLPIGSLSPQSIQRIRVFHVLSGHQVRQVAKDYIW